MAETAAKIQAVLSLIEAILQLLLAERVTEGLEIRKLTDSVRIQLIDACKSFLTNSFLVVGEEQSSELLSLEEVLAMVLGLCHSEHILVRIRLVLARRVKL